MPPLIKALDADADGTISAAELAGAPESLKTLDKNGDGELSPDELRPQGPPPRPDGPPPGTTDPELNNFPLLTIRPDASRPGGFFCA